LASKLTAGAVESAFSTWPELARELVRVARQRSD
jgi:hypothetical protein